MEDKFECDGCGAEHSSSGDIFECPDCFAITCDACAGDDDGCCEECAK